MQAREVIRRSCFDPKVLAVIGTAFDEVWSAVAYGFDTALAKEAARLVLANAILAHATSVSIEPSALKRAGLAVLAERYPRQVTRAGPAYLAALIDQSRATVARSQIDIRRLRDSVHSAEAAIQRSMALLHTGS
jgi:hypothetical protein